MPIIQRILAVIDVTDEINQLRGHAFSSGRRHRETFSPPAAEPSTCTVV